MTLEVEAGVQLGVGVNVEAFAGPAAKGRESCEKAILALREAGAVGREKARPLAPMRRPGGGGI